MLDLITEISAEQSQACDAQLIALSEVQLVLVGGGCGAASLD
jgi:hypothetical protein